MVRQIHALIQTKLDKPRKRATQPAQHHCASPKAQLDKTMQLLASTTKMQAELKALCACSVGWVETAGGMSYAPCSQSAVEVFFLSIAQSAAYTRVHIAQPYSTRQTRPLQETPRAFEIGVTTVRKTLLV